MTIAAEMPDEWVAEVVAAIEGRGWTVRDAHESAIVIELTPTAATALGADSADVLVIGWTEQYGMDWGVSSDAGATTATAQTLTEEPSPDAIGAAVDRLMLAGRPDARLVQHGVPETVPSASCRCTVAHPCGAFVVSADCVEHRAARMLWHWEGPACGRAN